MNDLCVKSRKEKPKIERKKNKTKKKSTRCESALSRVKRWDILLSSFKPRTFKEKQNKGDEDTYLIY